MKAILTAFVALFALMLGGCATQTVEKIVYKDRYIVVEPEARYFKVTPVPAPPPVKQYQPGEIIDWEAEYQELAARSIIVYKNLGMCNADKNGALLDLNQKKKRYE